MIAAEKRDTARLAQKSAALTFPGRSSFDFLQLAFLLRRAGNTNVKQSLLQATINGMTGLNSKQVETLISAV